MPNFIREASKGQLNSLSDFETIAQLAIRVYYLTPYPNVPPSKAAVQRPHHGGVHVSRTALNIELFLALYVKYAPHILRNRDDSPLDPIQIKLLKLSAIYHDSANISEIKGSEKAHARNFVIDMSALGFEERFVKPIASAMEFKEGAISEAHAAVLPKNIFQKIIHDADCLEIMRLNVKFDSHRLDVYKDLYTLPGFLVELDLVIQNHKEIVRQFARFPLECKTGLLHSACENSANCYDAVRASVAMIKLTIEKNRLLKYVLVECFKRGKLISTAEINLDALPEVDFCTVRTNAKVEALIEHLLQSPSEAEPIVSANDQALRLYATEGCFIRGLHEAELDEELAQLEKK